MATERTPSQVDATLTTAMDTDLPPEGSSLHPPRPPFTQAQFEAAHPRQPPPAKPSLASQLRSRCECSGSCIRRSVLQKLPFINTLRNYRWKEWILNDLIAGISIGVIHIPQGMGFSLLTSLPPVYGLYTSLFPVVLYFFFGTSQHISMGTMAITSLMIAAVIEQQLQQLGLPGTAVTTIGNETESLTMSPESSTAAWISDLSNASAVTSTMTLPLEFDEEAFRVDIATSVTLLMGLWQVVLSLLNMGVIATFMSMTFIGGFLTACAGYIVTSQVPSALGISIIRPSGMFSLPLTWYEIFKNIPSVNPADIIISIICLTFLIVVKEIINIRFQHKMKAPIPAELIVVIIAAVISYFCQLNDRFKVKIIGHIPKGLPVPQVPSMHNAQEYIVDSFLLAIIGFVVSVSMAKLMSRKHGYPIDQNQELFAIGMTFSVSAFFQCFGGTQAPPRSLVQDSAGGKTQLAGIFSSILVLMVCLLLAPAFQPLPKSVLASIIIVALLPLFKQFRDLKNYWKLNRYDFFTWLITWSVTSIFSITVGLLIGVAFSLLTIIIESFIAPALRMQNVHSDIYRPDGCYASDTKYSDGASSIPVVRFEAPLFFANLDRFKNTLMEASGVDLKAAKERMLKAKHQNGVNEKVEMKVGDKEKGDDKEQAETVALNIDGNFNDRIADTNAVVLDCSGIPYADIQGLNTLKQLHMDFNAAGIKLVFTGCSEKMLAKLENIGFLSEHGDSVFLTVHDAVRQFS